MIVKIICFGRLKDSFVTYFLFTQVITIIPESARLKSKHLMKKHFDETCMVDRKKNDIILLQVHFTFIVLTYDTSFV